ncbi:MULTISPECIES: DUF692 domain-containing protein [Bradyrhizobium]|jgi:uncharacterized protein|uniref:DUF692 domain-containing protein n=1 Tax=Bradyrhizobium japonicum TaxID=375 RepID=A0A1Y2JPU1_BRAJP|nr:DUF692 family multinuclear iron-containing protein [Bradyrhizobium japonicum]OSJ31334.1 hypothetical protein BSZ19_22190 [Bradyrhizobium japonicum]
MTFEPPRLGPGAIYLRSLDGLFRSHADLIKVAEIEPQSLWTKGTAPGSLPRGSPGELRHLQALPQTILTHGVGCPIGGTICDQARQVPQFRAWTEALNAPWTSEHLSIFHVRGPSGEQPCGFLMPPLQTEAGVSLAARNITRRAAALGKPFAFETGVNYFAPRSCEMPDGEFFRAVAEAADCGILLDLTNLWANHKNGRAEIHDVLVRLPFERVWEVHLAGLEFAHGHWLDAHSNGIDDELVDIASDVVADLPNLGAIIFEIAPDRIDRFGERNLLLEMEKVHLLWDRARGAARCTSNTKVSARQALAEPATLSPEDWERMLANRMLQSGGPLPVSTEQLELRRSDERAFSLYLQLVASFRRGAVAELMENTTRLLLLGMGESELRWLMDRYVAATPPVAFPTDEALSFRRFLEENPLAIPGLEDLSKFESTLIAAAADGGSMQVELSKDIDAMLDEIAMGRLPGPSTDRPGTVLEIAVDPVPVVRMIH